MNRTPRYAALATAAALAVLVSACGSDTDDTDTSIPDASIPDVTIPDVTTPDVTAPDVSLGS